MIQSAVPARTFTFEAVAESIGQARHALASLAASSGACEEDVERVRLAVSEAVSNSVIHGYGMERHGTVTLTAKVLGDELSVVVADQGCGFGRARASEGLGLGLAVITQLCDSLNVITGSSGGTYLEMRFRLSLALQVTRSLSGAGQPVA